MADFDKSKFDPKAAAEARKQEMDQMAQKLEAGVKDVFQGENYKAYLDFCAKMPRYSINNQILIMMQKPDATMCQSFTGWKEMGRFVKKGEKGIYLMSFIVQFLVYILSALIFVIVYARMIEIYLMVSLAPLPFATFGNKEQSMIGQNYLRSLFALVDVVA